MSKLDHLEALAQRLVEGTFNRFFRTQSDRPIAPAPSAANFADEQQIETKEVLRLYPETNDAGQWALRLEGRRLVLGEPVLNIGRALDNDIILSEPTVSRYHAQLRWRDHSYYLCPPQLHPEPVSPQDHQTDRSTSTPFTMVNGHPLSGPQQLLTPGDVIEFGQVSLVVEVA